MKSQDSGTPDVIHSEEFLQSLMRRQLVLSISCAASFVLGLFGLPLLNYFAPEMMARPVFGFPLTWLVLGVLFFPYVWLIAWVFIRKSISLEEQEVREVTETVASKANSGGGNTR